MSLDKLLTRALDESALLLVADDQGAIVHASARSVALFGEPPARLLGRELGALLAGEGGALADLWPTLRAGGAWTGDIARTEAGVVRWLRATVLPVRDDAGSAGFVAIAVDVPGPVATEVALRDAAELYATAPYGLHSLDANGVLIQVNDTWLSWTGHTREEVEGKLRFEQVLTAESMAHFRSCYDEFKEKGFVRDLEFTFRRKNGSTFPVLLSANAVKDAAGRFVRSRSVIIDLSDRKRAEAAEMLLKERLIAAVESVQDPFSIHDASDRLVLCNSAFRRSLSPSITGPVIGRKFEELLDVTLRAGALALGDETPEQFKRRRLAYRASPAGSFDERMSDGRVHRVFERRTTEGGTVSVLWDITDDVRRENELKEARKSAETANAAKSEFLSSMSHELRTPLNAILGFAQLLQRDKDPPLTPRQLGYLKHVLRGGEHLLTLIDEVLDLARVESGSIPISAEPVEVGDVLREVLATLGPMAQSRSVELRLAPVPLDLPRVVVDRTRFSQILLNYGSNAIKYNRAAGHVALSASAQPGGRVRVTVSDTGLGVPTERQAELFQAFHRLGQEAGPIEGTGIGLAITKRLADLMGGAVGARSVHGQGSDFWVEFPGLEPRPEAPPPRASSTSASETRFHSESRRYRLLYVEDNPANLALMQELLASLERFDLLSAPTAEIGIELARAHRPDIVVMDINLPGMSGYEALEGLRRWPETSAIPVLALSASAMDRDVKRAQQAGFARYLTKPVKIDEMLDALEQYLPRDRG